MKSYIKKFLGLIIIISLALTMSFGMNVSATDNDEDGLDDDWEGEHGYDNTTAEEVIIYDEEEWERKVDSESLLNTFLFVLLMSFAIFSLLAGIFTAYFGAGKSRAIGAVLLVLGLIIILIWIYFNFMSSYPNDTILTIVHWEAARTLEALVTVIGAIVGGLIAIVLFLVAIMKS